MTGLKSKSPVTGGVLFCRSARPSNGYPFPPVPLWGLLRTGILAPHPPSQVLSDLNLLGHMDMSEEIRTPGGHPTWEAEMRWRGG